MLEATTVEGKLAEAQVKIQALEAELAQLRGGGGLNRRGRRALVAQKHSFVRMIPMFQNAQGDAWQDGMQTYVIHTKPKDLVVLVVDSGTVSVERARKAEQEAVDFFKRDVFVVSDNVGLFRVEPVSSAEAAAMLRAA